RYGWLEVWASSAITARAKAAIAATEKGNLRAGLNIVTSRKRTPEAECRTSGDVEVKKLILAGALALTATASAFAQQPTCKMCPGTYIPNEEVQAYINRAKEFNIVDQQVRAVDVGKSNLAVGLVYRGKLDKPADMSV